MKNPKEVIAQDDWSYDVPQYKVTDAGIEDGPALVLRLCRGSKADPVKTRQEGVFTESLLEVCRQFLVSQNVAEMATKENSLAISFIEGALTMLDLRARDRQNRGVQQTYEK